MYAALEKWSLKNGGRVRVTDLGWGTTSILLEPPDLSCLPSGTYPNPPERLSSQNSSGKVPCILSVDNATWSSWMWGRVCRRTYL